MSKTTSDGVVGAGYWMFMASVMASRLDEIIQSGRISNGEIPKGVHNEACRFFLLILDDVGGNQPKNPPASSNAYFIAARALKRASETFPKTVPELDSVLKEYSEFLKALRNPHSLTSSEKKLARALMSFFLQLRDEGEEERHIRRLNIDTAPARSYSILSP